MSSDSISVYEPLQGPNTIRLLVLAPGEPDDEIVCSLLPIDLDGDHSRFPDNPRPMDVLTFASVPSSGPDQAPLQYPLEFDIFFDSETGEQHMHPFQRYFALSYVWGSPADPKHITLQGHRFPVTRNLHSALRRLRKPQMGLRVWIDALCMNQSDPKEKAGQVALMTRIYQQAEFVKADVAPTFGDEEGLDRILRTILRVGRASAALEEAQPGNDLESRQARRAAGVRESLSLTSTEHGMEYQGLPPGDDPFWLPWRQLFSSPYFRRVWILQEYALAASITFMIGGLEIDTGLLETCIRLLQGYSIAANMLYTGVGNRDDVESLGLSVLGMVSAQSMFVERKQAHQPGEGGDADNRLIFKLQRGRILLSSQARDKVFAMMGIASDGDSFKDLITYSPEVTARDICLRFAKRFVERGDGIEMLYQARRTPLVPGSPSWVPNWPEPPAGSVTRIADFEIPGHNFAAAGESPPEIKVLPDDRLNVRGAVFDSVASLSDPLDPQATLPPHLRPALGPAVEFPHVVQFIIKGGLLACGIQEYPTGEDYQEVLLRTFVRGPPWHDPKSQTDVQDLEVLRESFSSLLEWPRLLKGAERSRETERMKEIEAQTSVFSQDAAQRAYRRCFCITERGYFGLVPYTTQVGDSVGVVFGGPIPFVLRAAGGKETSERCYQLIGDGYFHGIMSGEALKFADTRVENFCFV